MSEHRSAIEALLHEYAERIDAGELDAVAELFAGATYRPVLDGEVATFRGAEEVRRVLSSSVQLHEDGTPSTKHVVTNVVIDVDEPAGTATARSYFTVLQARPDLPLQPVVAGRYEDRFDRSEGAWRFTDRVIRTDLVGDLSRHLASDPFAS